MKKLTLFVGVILGLVTVGCGSENSNDSIDPNVTAPTTISGKSIKGTITSGTGGFASSGRSTFVASSTDNKYKVLGDGINTINSRGTFSYNVNNNKATIVFDDSVLGEGHYNFTFTTKTSGTYTANTEQNPIAKQTGTFELL